MRDWRSLPVHRKGPPGQPHPEQCVMLILRGDPDEIEGGSFPPPPPDLDQDEIERLVGRPVTGWVAIAGGEPLIGPWKPNLSDNLKDALRDFGANCWVRDIPGSDSGLDDDALLWFNAYGPDADAMLERMRPMLAERPILPASFAVLYRGRGAKERVFLDPR